jgi:hypothetical protein
MLPTDTRCFISHEKGLLDPGVLGSVREHFLREEEVRQSQVLDENDALRVSMGASTSAFRFDPRWYDPWRNAPAELVERLRPFTWLLFPVQIRHIKAGDHLVPWHQDAGYVRLMSRKHARLITCFVPLEPDPRQCASLEFAEGEYGELDHSAFGNHGAAILDRDFAGLRRFELSFGDALVFGDLAPHQTIPAPDGTIDRRSFEYRFVIPAEALPDKDYFDIEKGCFVRTDGSQREFPE